MKTPEPVDIPAGLYLVATPIGNLRDISLRALDILAGAALIICEDTRVSGKLLKAYNIATKMIAYNDHNAARQRPAILERLSQGQALALISDAGTPLISDPGYKLVRDCLDLGIHVTSLPGANAPLTALQLSGLPSDKFSFLGFLPPKQAARRKLLEEWRAVPGSLIMFESGPRLADTLKDLHGILGDRDAAVIREMTKMYEEKRRDKLSVMAAYYDEAGAPKGEIVIVTGPMQEENWTDEILNDALKEALKSMHVKDAAADIAGRSGVSRKKLYEMALKLEKGS